MLKPYNELVKLDVTPYLKERDGMSYLPWPKCYELLHENGAELVYHEPLIDERTGSSLFMSNMYFGKNAEKPEERNRCYEVRVRITIDDLVFTVNYPLMNGSNPVRDNSLSQLRVNNAQQRAFVKGVAMRTGLGFSVWSEDDDLTDDLGRHKIYAIKKRVEELLTLKLQSMSQRDMLTQLGMSERQLETTLGMYAKLDSFEKAVSRL